MLSSVMPFLFEVYDSRNVMHVGGSYFHQLNDILTYTNVCNFRGRGCVANSSLTLTNIVW